MDVLGAIFMDVPVALSIYVPGAVCMNVPGAVFIDGSSAVFMGVLGAVFTEENSYMCILQYSANPMRNVGECRIQRQLSAIFMFFFV